LQVIILVQENKRHTRQEVTQSKTAHILFLPVVIV